MRNEVQDNLVWRVIFRGRVEVFVTGIRIATGYYRRDQGSNISLGAEVGNGHVVWANDSLLRARYDTRDI